MIERNILSQVILHELLHAAVLMGHNVLGSHLVPGETSLRLYVFFMDA